MTDSENSMAKLAQRFKEEQERVGEVILHADFTYPLEIHGLDIRQIRHGETGISRTAIGSMVSIRPVAEGYKGKTFLGVYLGELPIDIVAGFQTKIKTLVVVTQINPAIFVPELNKIIYGIESWWGVIESEEQLRQITNDDIQNIWYVKALQELIEKQEQAPETEA